MLLLQVRQDGGEEHGLIIRMRYHQGDAVVRACLESCPGRLQHDAILREMGEACTLADGSCHLIFGGNRYLGSLELAAQDMAGGQQPALSQQVTSEP